MKQYTLKSRSRQAIRAVVHKIKPTKGSKRWSNA